MDSVRTKIAKATLSMRFLLVKLITPQFYHLNNHFPPEPFTIPTRPFTILIKAQRRKSLVGVEIGVYKGENAESFLKNLPLKRLYLVDPYIDMASFFNYTRKRLAPFKRKISFIKQLSQNATSSVPDNLDFVYVDGNHEYEFVTRDLELYYPKVRKGGVLGGHDFAIDHYDVAHAVVDFASKHGLKVYGEDRDWWIICEDRVYETMKTTETFEMVLKAFDRDKFARFRHLVCACPLPLNPENMESHARIKHALQQVDLAKLPVRLELSKEDFRFLTVLTDIISVSGECRKLGYGETYEQWHSYFVMLQKMFRRVFKENVYDEEE